MKKSKKDFTNKEVLYAVFSLSILTTFTNIILISGLLVAITAIHLIHPIMGLIIGISLLFGAYIFRNHTEKSLETQVRKWNVLK